MRSLLVAYATAAATCSISNIQTVLQPHCINGRVAMEIQEVGYDWGAAQAKMLMSLQRNEPACEVCKESDATSDTPCNAVSNIHCLGTSMTRTQNPL